MNDWRETTLGDEIELAYGKSLPAHAREVGQFGVFGSNGLVGSHIEACVKGPGIVIGRKGSVGAVTYSTDAFWPIDTTYFVINKGGHDWRFLYHVLRHIDLTGLNSHSAVPGLNREDVYSIAAKLPTRDEQKDIASVLDCVENSIRIETAALENAQELKRAAMRELFTRGLRGEVQKETEIGLVPESWVAVSIADLGEVVTGTTPPTRERAYYDDGNIPFISPGDIEHGTAIVSTQKCITDSGLAVSRALPVGTTCVVCIGSTIGKVGRTTAPASATNQQINAIVPGVGYDPNYLSHLLTYQSNIVRNAASPSPVPILSKGVFEKLVLYTSTNPDEQVEIAAILDAVDRKIDLHQKKRKVLEELFESLLHKLMTSEIAVSDLDLSALSPASAQPEEAKA